VAFKTTAAHETSDVSQAEAKRCLDRAERLHAAAVEALRRIR
jgi:hypothetical protein